LTRDLLRISRQPIEDWSAPSGQKSNKSDQILQIKEQGILKDFVVAGLLCRPYGATVYTL
ncbi:MAG: hypothetical protein J5957_03710, partial [Prevotella sp.]|nr:hypothetical protein [Prevotella sp.]